MNSNETREEKRSRDMVDSMNRAGLPETGSRAAQPSGFEDGRQDASAMPLRADLDRENGVLR